MRQEGRGPVEADRRPEPPPAWLTTQDLDATARREDILMMPPTGWCRRRDRVPSRV